MSSPNKNNKPDIEIETIPVSKFKSIEELEQDIINSENKERIKAHKISKLPILNSCSYDRGYITQLVNICLTCNEYSKNSQKAGLCAGCAYNCHDEDHEIIELGYKRNFRCDCGNSNFHQSCDYQQEKEYINENNKYNHNFDNKFCYCDDVEGEMSFVQHLIFLTFVS